MALDDKQYQQGINNAGNSATSFGGIAAKAFAAVGAAAVGMAAAVVKVGSDFEAQMSVVQAISGATGREMDALSDKAKFMGATTQFSATEAGEAFEYMAMAGWDASQMVDGLSGIMYAAGASGENLALVADIITDGLTAFGESADQAGRFADVLAAAASNSNTNIAMMGETFKYVAPVAGSLGYSMEDVAVATGLMANSGIKASQAGTTLRQLFTNLAKPTDSMAKAMSDLNIELESSPGVIKPLNELLVDMRESFADLTQAEQAQYAATIAGTRGMSGLLAIVNATDDEFDSLTEAIYDSAGAAEAMNAIRLDNLQGDVTILGSALEGLGIQIYESFNAPLRSAVQEGTEGINTLAAELAKPEMVNSLETIADGFSDLIKVISSVVTTVIPPLVSGVSTTIDVLKFLTPAIITAGSAFAVVKGIQTWQSAVTAATTANTIMQAAMTALQTQTASSIVTDSLKAASVQKGTLAEAARTAALAAGLTVNEANQLVTAKGVIVTEAEAAALIKSSTAMSAKSVITAVLTGQMTLATGASVLFGAALKALPFVAVVAGAAALVTGIVQIVKWFNRESEESKQLKSDLEDLSEANTALSNSIDESSAAYAANLKSIEAQTYASKSLIDRVYDLADAYDGSSSSLAEINSYIQSLNDSNEGLGLSFDATTGALNRTREAAENYIDTLAEQQAAQIAQERTTELLRQRYEIEEQLAISSQKIAEAQELYGEGTRDYNKATEDTIATMEELESTLADVDAAIEYNAETIERTSVAASNAITENFGIIQLAYESLDDFQKTAVDGILESYGTMTSGLADLSGSIVYDQAKAWADIQAIQDNNIEKTAEFADVYSQLLEAGVSGAYLEALNLDRVEATPTLQAMLNEGINVVLESQSQWEDAYGTIADTFLDAFDLDETSRAAIKDYVLGESGIYGSLVDAVNLANFGAVGESIGEGTAEGITESAVLAAVAATHMAEDTITAARAALDSHSPSREFVSIGEDIVEGLELGISANFNSVISVVQEWGSRLVSEGNTIMREFVETNINIVSELPVKFYDSVFPIIERFDSIAVQLIGLSFTRMTEFVDTTKNVISVLPGEFYTIGQDMIIGLGEGLQSKTGWFFNILDSFIRETVSRVKDGLDIRSPSRVFKEIGEFVVIGFAQGIEGMSGMLDKTMSNVFNPKSYFGYDFDDIRSLKSMGSSSAQSARTNSPTIIQNIQSVDLTPLQNEQAARAAFTQAAWGW